MYCGGTWYRGVDMESRINTVCMHVQCILLAWQRRGSECGSRVIDICMYNIRIGEGGEEGSHGKMKDRD
jgi:hypothetical protein